MKFGELRSIGHNIADSLTSGIGLLIGVYQMDVFDEALRAPEGYIEVDFLKGAVTHGVATQHLRRAIVLYTQALPSLCLKHRCSVTAFRSLTARFSVGSDGPRFDVSIEDQRGRSVTDEYIGSPGKYIRVLDANGRVRRKRASITRSSVLPFPPT